ncbi:HlyD family efflux transporter periplasmic adaptor subunit [Actinoplanes derwentensis]|uniref:HlyD family secretion protein n=1 Tax=Actinoplanes derwentensis TaxID=113562 RepID=A0A1H2CX17_9ACTN|nr:HlyD family efflux transporter periplasmic adaptor subunit [Actinoplanes derwentensis]GID87849.1 hypothetical protein Ade03nite_67730 [Actinoplanes derwentensis]SDT74797.1 HlyD family secretion protein [Actinoplanes derwentensis]
MIEADPDGLGPTVVIEPAALADVRSRDRRRVLIAGATVATMVLLAGAAVLLGPRLQSPEQQAAEAAPPPASLVTAEAETRVLVEPIVLRGSVVPGASVKLLPPSSLTGADSVVTAVNVRKGDRIAEGVQILECKGAPVVALELPFPFYRDIIGGSTGPDVLALQQAMRRLGYAAPRNSKMDAATQRALVKWWRALGYEAPKMSDTSGAGSADPDDPATGTEDPAVAEKTEPTAEQKRQAAEAALAAGAYLPRAAVIRITESGRVSKVNVKRADILTGQTKPLLELNGAASTLQATVTKEQVGLVTVGQPASVLDELSGKKVKAEVSKIGSTVVTDEASGTTGFVVRFAFTGAAITAEGRSLRVDFSSGADDTPRLAVPVTAVYSRADGTTFVKVSTDGRTETEVTVETGQTGGGWTAIEPSRAGAITEGTPVVVGRS